MTATTTYPCSRCAGTGRLNVFSHVLGGTCFKCGGSGKQRHKPSAPSVRWAVFGENRQTGAVSRLYNVDAKTAEAAVEKARRVYERASSLWRDEWSLAHARAVRCSDLADPAAIKWESAVGPITAFYADRRAGGLAALAQ